MTVDLPDGDDASRAPSEDEFLEDPIRLLIADDDDRTTMVLRDSLPAFGFDVVGEARNGEEAGDKAASLKPEVVLLTSDSAGDPKGVLRTRKNLEAISEIVCTALEVDQDCTILTCACPTSTAWRRRCLSRPRSRGPRW